MNTEDTHKFKILDEIHDEANDSSSICVEI